MEQIIAVENAAQEIERSAEDKKAITKLKTELFESLAEERKHDDALESCRLKLGALLESARQKKAWADWGHPSWGSFLDSIAGSVRKGRTSLYNYASTAKELLPYISPEELPEVGITKGRALASAVKKAGKRPSDTLLNAAKSPAITVEEMHQLIADNYGARDETEKGIWLELGGCYLSPEERKEFEDTVSAVIHTDPVLPYNVKWHEASAPQKKEILWRLCAEYLSAHPEVTTEDVFVE